MSVCAVVPVKRLSVSKRRLSAVFNPEERKLLTLAMLENVLAALKESVVTETVVVSEDAVVHEVAKKFGFSHFSASGAGLNSDIEEASQWCLQKQARSVLVLPADLPLVSPQDIDTIVKLGSEKPSIVLSPSQNGGTNALYQNPPNLIPVCFGPKSFVNHYRAACSKGITLRMYYSLGTALDIDSVEDLKLLLEKTQATKCKQVFEQFAQRRPKTS
jgi:2-phospho-L-lactate/phosphoenolpyruvate guanylyltransferase